LLSLLFLSFPALSPYSIGSRMTRSLAFRAQVRAFPKRGSGVQLREERERERGRERGERRERKAS